MIKFFRQIRFKLLEKGKTTHYLKYAIGEIILVVIGILIALQINNWNQNRLNKQKSIDFHQRLAEELDALNARMIGDAERADQLITYISTSVKILKKGELSSKGRDTLNFTFQSFFQFSRVNSQLKTFEEMKSTGQLGLIYNSDLKNQLLDFLTYLEEISNIYVQLSDKVNNTEPFDKHITINISSNMTQGKLEYDFEQLCQDKFLINTLARYGYNWQTKKFFSEKLKQSSKNLKDAILQELEKNSFNNSNL